MFSWGEVKLFHPKTHGITSLLTWFANHPKPSRAGTLKTWHIPGDPWQLLHDLRSIKPHPPQPKKRWNEQSSLSTREHWKTDWNPFYDPFWSTSPHPSLFFTMLSNASMCAVFNSIQENKLTNPQPSASAALKTSQLAFEDSHFFDLWNSNPHLVVHQWSAWPNSSGQWNVRWRNIMYTQKHVCVDMYK